MIHLLYVTEIADTTAELEDASADLEKNVKRKKTAEAQLSSKKKGIAKLKNETALVDKKIKKQEATINKMKTPYIKLREEIKNSKKHISEAKMALEKAQRMHRSREDEVSELQQELKTVEKALGRWESSVEGESQGDTVQLEDAQMAMYSELKEKVATQTASLQDELSSLNDKNRGIVDKGAMIRDNITELRTRHAQLEKEREQLEHRCQKLEENHTKYKVSLKENETKLARLQKEQESALAQQNDAHSRLDEVMLGLREAKADKHESTRVRKFNEAVETMKRHFPGVQGKLIDLCAPVHNRYNVAVTVIMGKNMDAVVVDSEKTAHECMKYLRDQRAGYGTFLPLDSIRVKDKDDRLRSVGRGTRLVRDVLEFDDSIERAIMYACGNAVVCESETEARRLCYDRSAGIAVTKAVTLDGTIVKSSGPIEGGLSGVQDKANRWEEKQVDSLKRDRDALQKKLVDLKRTLRDTREMELCKASIKGSESRLKWGKGDLDAARNKVTANGDEISSVLSRISALQPDLDQALADAAANEPAIAKLTKLINAATDKVFRLFCQEIGVRNIREYEETKLARAEERASKRAEYNKQIVQLRSQLEYEQSRNTLKEVENCQRLLGDHEDKLSALKRKEGEQTSAITEAQDVLDEQLRKQGKEHAANVAEMEVEVAELRKHLGSQTRSITSLHKQVTLKETHLEKLQASRHAYFKLCKVEEIHLPFIDGSMEDVADESVASAASAMSSNASATMSSVELDSLNSEVARRIHNKETNITLDYSELNEDLVSIDSPEDLADVDHQFVDKLQEITSHLESLAPNLKAIERLDGAVERLKESADEFDVTLKEARTAAAEFERVKTERTERFMKGFAHIHSQIDRIYKDLTKSAGQPLGGTAYLSLENSEEPYLGGVKYNAMPPMKRFRDMDQLSGGEKTVAALALLFAVHSFQPAPFFVLDEVDAALDNINLTKVL